jgi:hypothetical protein
MAYVRLATLTLVVVLTSGLSYPVAAQLTQAKAQEILQKEAQAVNSGQRDSSLTTVDEITITAYGMTAGRSQGDDLIARLKQMGVNVEYKVTKVENLAGDRAAIAVGTYHVTYTNNPATKAADGNFLQVLVRDGQDWKTKASSTTRLSQPGVMSGSSTSSR